MKTALRFGIMGFLLILLSAPVRAGDGFFFDVLPSSPHFSAITALQQAGVLTGFPDHTFRADQNVNRAEALQIILHGSGIPVPDSIATSSFPDVAPDDWFAVLVSVAKNKGIIQGSGAGKFEPARSLTQAEALKMIFGANAISTTAPKKAPFPQIDPQTWFAPFYAQAKTAAMILPNEVDPAHALSRGELAEIMERFFQGAKSYAFPIGNMSYYGDATNGSKTANGATFDNAAFTAAHRTLDFGQHVLVRSLTSGKAVVVSVTDRGPFTPFRTMDLSKSAFAVLEDPSSGVTKAELEPVDAGIPTGPVQKFCALSTERATIPVLSFSGITLNEPLPRLFRQNEFFALNGKAPGAQEVTIFWDGGDTHETQTVAVQNGTFHAVLAFRTAGKFDLGILPGRSGQAVVLPITVASGECFTTVGKQPDAVTDLRGEIQQGTYVLSWKSASSANFFRVLLSQGEKTQEFFVNGSTTFAPPPAAFADFVPGPAEVRVFAGHLSSAFSADPDQPFSSSRKIDLVMAQHYYADKDAGRVQSGTFPETFTPGKAVSFSGTVYGKLENKAAIVFPDGSITDLPLQIKDTNFSLSFTPDKVGTHLIEINSDQGIAVYNAPLYPEGFAPLLPDYFDLFPREKTAKVKNINLSFDRTTLLNLLNTTRKNAGLSNVVLQDNLNELAQARADDMVKRHYFAHINPDGQNVSALAPDFGVLAAVSENIAVDVALRPAHEGLLRSAIHRRNIVNPYWKFTGIGLALDPQNGELIVVELFSEETLTNSSRAEYRTQILDVLNKRRKTALVADQTLQQIADDWAEKMTTESFFAAVSPKGGSLQDALKAAHISTAVQTALYQYDSLAELLDVFSKRADTTFLWDEKWQKAGIGLYISPKGILTVVLLFNS